MALMRVEPSFTYIFSIKLKFDSYLCYYDSFAKLYHKFCHIDLKCVIIK